MKRSIDRGVPLTAFALEGKLAGWMYYYVLVRPVNFNPKSYHCPSVSSSQCPDIPCSPDEMCASVLRHQLVSQRDASAVSNPQSTEDPARRECDLETLGVQL